MSEGGREGGRDGVEQEYMITCFTCNKKQLLFFSNNSISDIGAEELGVALCTNHTLQGLSLWNNRVFHSGAESLANGLAANTTLTWLGVNNLVRWLLYILTLSHAVGM